ncbi:hypothetical protein JAAARDRAFT_42587 [Jaapia argillacea MUCL 33604]|uniref:Uncharacterized protein n=1 Tax=Jaapia argillacea MUCL 33604 TaxID=933084 RepID=A0A067P4N6_9AGAM|nr:hypothetical protein JAAARDRAFT_42587 [Jaapia argillacea MUCL 33604]
MTDLTMLTSSSYSSLYPSAQSIGLSRYRFSAASASTSRLPFPSYSSDDDDTTAPSRVPFSSLPRPRRSDSGGDLDAGSRDRKFPGDTLLSPPVNLFKARPSRSSKSRRGRSPDTRGNMRIVVEDADGEAERNGEEEDEVTRHNGKGKGKEREAERERGRAMPRPTHQRKRSSSAPAIPFLHRPLSLSTPPPPTARKPSPTPPAVRSRTHTLSHEPPPPAPPFTAPPTSKFPQSITQYQPPAHPNRSLSSFAFSSHSPHADTLLPPPPPLCKSVPF